MLEAKAEIFSEQSWAGRTSRPPRLKMRPAERARRTSATIGFSGWGLQGPASAVVSASRSVIYAYRDVGTDFREAAGAEASRLKREVWAASGW